jgi:hypothetical protein
MSSIWLRLDEASSRDGDQGLKRSLLAVADDDKIFKACDDEMGCG